MSKKLTGNVWNEARKKAARALAEMTDEEDAEFTRAARADPDTPPLTAANFARMRPAIEVMPEIVRRARRQRGPQKSKPVKTLISLRLDPEVIAHFRKLGPGWQARINEALRKAAGLKKRA